MDDNGASRQQIIAASMWEGSFQDDNGASRGQQIIANSVWEDSIQGHQQRYHFSFDGV